MAFTLQNPDGTIDGANAYVDASTVREYWADRGVDLSAQTDEQLQAAIVKATTYLDARYPWVGVQRRRDQGTQWPRLSVSSFLRGLPHALTTATCMVASRALTRDLMPDPTFQASGQELLESTKKVGPIEVTQKFAESRVGSLKEATPQFPEVTLTLQSAGLILSGASGTVKRG